MSLAVGYWLLQRTPAFTPVTQEQKKSTFSHTQPALSITHLLVVVDIMELKEDCNTDLK